MFILKIPYFSIIIRHFTFLEENKVPSNFRLGLKTLLYVQLILPFSKRKGTRVLVKDTDAWPA